MEPNPAFWHPLIFCINKPVPTPCLFLPCPYFYTWDMGRGVKFKNVFIRGVLPRYKSMDKEEKDKVWGQACLYRK
jgi:hypothetical protein